MSSIERLERPGATFGILHTAQHEDGSVSMPWYELSADAEELVGGLHERGLVVKFDWPAWSETARSYVDDPELLAQASMDDCVRLLTTHVRKDRFCEEHLVDMLECGRVAAVLRRMREIRRRRQPADR